MGGKNSPPPPDYSGLEEVANEQLRFAKQQYADMFPIAQEVAQSQIDAQRQQMQQAQDYYDYQMNTFRPLEQQLVADAERFNTDAYRQQKAAEASAAAGRAFATARGSSMRSMAARGVNPNSGAARGADRGLMLSEAAMRASGMTSARQQAEQMGYARRLDATGLGRGLAGASAAAYGGAVGAGSAGLGSAMAPGTQYQQGLAGAGQTFGQLTNIQADMYNQAQNRSAEMAGALVGAGAGAGLMIGSDRRLKADIEFVGVDDHTGLNLYSFRYKADEQGRKFVGVMADEVKAQYPDAVTTHTDGYDYVNYTMLGIEMVEVMEA